MPLPAGPGRVRHDPRVLTDGERTFLRAQRVARLATATADGVPDVVTVRYQMRGDDLVVGGPGFDATIAWANLAATSRAAVLVEERHGEVPDRGVVVQGLARPVPGAAVPVVAITATVVRGFGLEPSALG